MTLTPKMAKRMKSTNGMTLMEILVAMGLLVGVGMAIFGALISAAKLAQPTPEKYTAYNHARQEAENLANAVRDDWWGGGAPGGARNLNVGSHTICPPTCPTIINEGGTNVSYTPSYLVTQVDHGIGAIDEYRKVDVKVCWNEPGC